MRQDNRPFSDEHYRDEHYRDEHYRDEHYRTGKYVPPGNYQQINGSFLVHLDHGGFLPLDRAGHATCYRKVSLPFPLKQDQPQQDQDTETEEKESFKFLYLVLPNIRFSRGDNAK